MCERASSLYWRGAVPGKSPGTILGLAGTCRVPFRAEEARFPPRGVTVRLVSLVPVRKRLDDQRCLLGSDGVPLLEVREVDAVKVVCVVEAVQVPSVSFVPKAAVLGGEVGECTVALADHAFERLHSVLTRRNELDELQVAGPMRVGSSAHVLASRSRLLLGFALLRESLRCPALRMRSKSARRAGSLSETEESGVVELPARCGAGDGSVRGRQRRLRRPAACRRRQAACSASLGRGNESGANESIESYRIGCVG